MSNKTDTIPTLKSLAVSPGKLSPNFWTEHQQYAVFVPHAVESIQITAVPESPEARVTVGGTATAAGQPSAPVRFPVGRTVVNVEVTIPGAAAKTIYPIKIIRAQRLPTWVKVRENCPWSPRDSSGELVFKDRMWIFGGYTPGLVSDVWSSADGSTWEKVGEIPCPSGINIPLTWVYGDKMWVTSNVGKLFSSPDGVHWTLVIEKPPFGPRYAAGSAVFAGRMWVLGGGPGGFSSEIWSSTDGANWTLETQNAPWSRRQLFSLLTVHAGKLWILGGGIVNYHPFKAYNDIWNSSDGKTWTKVTDDAGWPGRIWSSAVTYRNRMWVFSGFRAEPVWTNLDDTWYSADGAHWNRLAPESVWSARHEVCAYVFQDKLWVVGGNAWPLVNDVWCLEIKGLTFLTQPVIEEFVQAQYTYRACADFNASCRPIRYRLVEAPAWLAVDAETGQIRGTPPAAGQFQVTVEAKDDAGETAQQAYTLHVLGPGEV